MDIKCKVCREPWDMDSLHDLVAEGRAANFDEAREWFYRDGCEAFGSSHGEIAANGDAIGMLQELLGDDVDGLAALTEDFGL